MAPNLGVKLPLTGGLPMWPKDRKAGEWATFVEDLGYDSLWMTEAWGANAFVHLTEVALETERLQLGTAVTNVYARSPAVLAMAAASLARLSNGRAILGLGTGHPAVIEGLHDTPYEQPVRRTHETIEAIRAFTGGDKSVDYDGELFETSGFPGLDEPVRIFNAALGEANRRATGRVADGWLPYLLPFSQLTEAHETIATTAHEVGRDPAEIEVRPQVLAVVDEDLETARQPIREYLANYVGNYEAYRNVVREVFPDEVSAIAEAWNSGDEATAVATVTNEMVSEFGVAGPPERVRDELRDVLDIDVVDACIVYVPNGASVETYERTFTELAPRQF